MRIRRTLLPVLLMVGLLPAVGAQTQSMVAPTLRPGEYKPVDKLPEAVRDLGFEQKPGELVPLETQFVDSFGREVSLGSLISDRPVILAPVYYECPMLCSLVLDGIVRGIKPLQYTPGQEFDVIAISFDHEETPELADITRNTILSRYRREGSAAGWHFLTGSEESIAAVMDAVGFLYEYAPETDLWSHAGGVILLTPEGKVSRYFYGVDYPPKDLKLGLVEASEGRVGSFAEQVLLFCFQYDPTVGKYSANVLNLIRAAGVVTVLALLGYIFVRRRTSTMPDPTPAS